VGIGLSSLIGRVIRALVLLGLGLLGN
jgi:hypothetical protein